MSILSILDELAADNSRLAKEAILKREKNNTLLRDVFKAAYDPYINYWQIKIPPYQFGPECNRIELDIALVGLQQLTDRTYTGNAGKDYLADILRNLSKNDAEVIERIISRDLRVGCSDSTANKVWPGLIPTFDVMLAYKDCSGIKFPCIGQVKMDGMRVHMVLSGSHAELFTRTGKSVTTHGVFDYALSQMLQPGDVIDGELLCMDNNGQIMDRKTGNGICNKGVKGTISPSEASSMRFVAWDMVDFSGTIPYIDRLNNLAVRIKFYHRSQKNPMILQCPTRDIHSNEEAQDFFKECRDNGEEGCILKNTNAVWQPKRTKDLGKMKDVLDCSLRITEWLEGTGKYKGLLGALTGESEDGKIKVNVGSGFSDKERQMTAKDVVGKIMDIQYNARIQDKKSTTESLFLPRFIEIRTDKTVADKSGAIL